jgi:nucleotide-binding universal stress UspA family protein
MKVLVATDFSTASPTIKTIRARPWPAGTKICILHVVDLAPFEPGAELLEVARRGAESVVKSISRDLDQSGFQTQSEVVIGHPRIAISDFAKQWGADLVVVGSHGATGLARFLLGSVAQAVVRGAPCSVEVVRSGDKNVPGPSSAWKILLATDGSDCAKVAARSIAERPWPSGTVVRVLSAVPLFMPITDAGTAYFEAGRAIELAQLVEAESRSRATEAIAETKKILLQPGGVQIESTELISGDPKRVIVEDASKWGATMIVVGSHGRRGLDRLTMGSVSEFVAMHAHCSVDVIR